MLRGLRFQFTIGRLLALVALAAVLASVFARFHWMFGLACTIAAAGFVIDRIKDRSGIMGAMIFGTFGLAAFGLVVFLFEGYRGQQTPGERPSTYVLFCGCLGLFSGMIVGLGGWAVLALIRFAGEAWALVARAGSRA